MSVTTNIHETAKGKHKRKRAENLAEVFAASPFGGPNHVIERGKDEMRPVFGWESASTASKRRQ
jgi:hypothetical protein